MLSEKWVHFSLKLLPARQSILELIGYLKEAFHAGETKSWGLSCAKKETHENLPQAGAFLPGLLGVELGKRSGLGA